MYYNCNMVNAAQQVYSDLSGNKLVDVVTKDISGSIGACYPQQIEDGIEYYFLNEYKCANDKKYDEISLAVSNILKNQKVEPTIENAALLLQALMNDSKYKEQHGIVYTPKYISDYIVRTLINENVKNVGDKKVLDPSCGCGIFLASAAEQIFALNCGLTIDDIIENCIFGIELDTDSARRADLLLKIVSAKNGGRGLSLSANIACLDSLKTDWNNVFYGANHFDFIVGNPPYINPHDMEKDYSAFLREKYTTVAHGTYNIYYAFIEESAKYISEDGQIGYIIPNNFLTIKSAFYLRSFLNKKSLVDRIIDFGCNMPFAPVRTYNCILFLSNSNNPDVEYAVMDKTADIKGELDKIELLRMPKSHLDDNGWKLIDKSTYANIQKIESQMVSLKQFVRTGIATLKDAVYFVNKLEDGFYKDVDGERFSIEPGIVKTIYKIPELKGNSDLVSVRRYIIFPYAKSQTGYIPMSDKELKHGFPKAYAYLVKMSQELEKRSAKKEDIPEWFSYGRSQGLNKYGRKLLFPTFSNKPNYMLVEDEDALFCNGYAVFENDKYDLEILGKVLNSKVMDYYIRNTSYQIEGGYFCYQKRYIQNFSLPWLNDDTISDIKALNGEQLDNYLWKLYSLQ